MATYTTNYKLNKPTFAELADVRTFNGNMDIIDTVMNASQNSIAEPYDSTETYNEGDMVMYELYLYRCLEETTGTWDATKWERAYSASSGAGIVYPQDATKYLNGVGQWTVPAGGGGGVNYSTTEQVIGTWIDGKTIYQKTYVFNQSIPIQSSSYADITQEVPDYVDMDTIVTAFVTSNSKATDSVWCGMDNNTFCLYCAEGINADTLTITYTKVTV